MSHDASYIIRDGEQQQYFYSRWGGVQLASDLLQGPEAFQDYVRGLKRLERPFLENYITSLAEIDLQQRRLRYWGIDGFGYDALSWRMHCALLQSQWPGWTIEWLYQPADAMQVAETRVHTSQVTVADVQAWQSALWHDLKERFTDLIEQQGEAATRAMFETPYDQFNTWVTVRSEQGLRDEILCNQFLLAHAELFLLGPDLVEVLEARPQRPFNELQPNESDLSACCFIDLVEQRFFWWVLTPCWDPPYDIQKAWPGWEVEVLTEGPTRQLTLTGRAPSALRTSYSLTQLDEWFNSLLEPRQSPLELLTKVADNMAQRSGGNVEITLPGKDSEGIPQTPTWINDVKRHYAALLNTPAFQPRLDR